MRLKLILSSPESIGILFEISNHLSFLNYGKFLIFLSLDLERAQNLIPLLLLFLYRSLTDTSYFPTEDLGDVPEQPQGSEGTSGSKDLAFLGYTVSSFFSELTSPLWGNLSLYLRLTVPTIRRYPESFGLVMVETFQAEKSSRKSFRLL